MEIGPKGGVYFKVSNRKIYLKPLLKFSPFTERFSIILDSQFSTKESCIKNLKNTKLANKGTESKIYSVCQNEECNKYILRITVKEDENYSEEIKMSLIASEKEFGVKIYDQWLCDIKIKGKDIYSANFMIMDKYDISLQEWFNEYGKKYYEKEKDNIISHLSQLINEMHESNIKHNDLHADNIMVKNEKTKIISFAIIDFGRSKFEKDIKYSDQKTLASVINEKLSALNIPDSISYKDLL